MKILPLFILLLLSGTAYLNAQAVVNSPEPDLAEFREAGHADLIPYREPGSAGRNDTLHSGRVIMLNEAWNYHRDDTGSGNSHRFFIPGTLPENWPLITIPLLPSGEESANTSAFYYTRTLDLPESLQGMELFLRLNGPAAATSVWMNGTRCGFSKGSGTPVEFYLSPFIDGRRIKIGLQSTEALTGEIMLIARPSLYIRDIQLEENYTGSAYELRTTLAVISLKQGQSWDQELGFSLLAPDGKEIARFRKKTAKQLGYRQEQEYVFDATIPEPEEWGTEIPALYTLNIFLHDRTTGSGEAFSFPWGLRRINMEGDSLRINGMVPRLTGTRQTGSATFIMNPEGKVEDGVSTIIAGGEMNARFLNFCDRNGILIIPVQEPDKTLEDMSRCWGLHPCIVAWALPEKEKGDCPDGADKEKSTGSLSGRPVIVPGNTGNLVIANEVSTE